MNAFHPTRATQLVVGVAFLAVSAIVLTTSAALAVSCEDVRGLTRAQQNYWSKRLNLTAEQRHRIWLECYAQPRVFEAKGNSVQSAAPRQ
jgi:Spy/CpxP family protein refolding chaperone